MTDNKTDAKSKPQPKTETLDQTKANDVKTDDANKPKSTLSSTLDPNTLASKSAADSKVDNKADSKADNKADSKADNKADNKATAKTAPKPEATMKKVDIVIAGVTYSVFCPVDEESELREAVHYINDFTINIKREAPHLKQENLLVLACLNLYEKIHTNNKLDSQRKQDSDQTEALLNKVIADAQSIL